MFDEKRRHLLMTRLYLGVCSKHLATFLELRPGADRAYERVCHFPQGYCLMLRDTIHHG